MANVVFLSPSMQPAVDEATRLFLAGYPGQTTPSAYGLAVAIGKGASSQRAADQAGFFYQNAVFPDGKVYGSGYNAWVMEHNDGEVDGFGYGMSAAEFKATYQTAAAPPDPNFVPKDCGQGWQWNAATKVCEPIPGYWNPVGSFIVP